MRHARPRSVILINLARWRSSGNALMDTARAAARAVRSTRLTQAARVGTIRLQPLRADGKHLAVWSRRHIDAPPHAPPRMPPFAFPCHSLTCPATTSAQVLRFLLQEVVRSATCHMRLASPGSRVELYEVVFEVLVHLQDGSLVAAAVAVIGR